MRLATNSAGVVFDDLVKALAPMVTITEGGTLPEPVPLRRCENETIETF